MSLGLAVVLVNFAVIAIVVVCGTLLDSAADRSDSHKNDTHRAGYR